MLVYLLGHASREAAKKSFADFLVDPDWVKARTASEARAGGSRTEPQGGWSRSFPERPELVSRKAPPPLLWRFSGGVSSRSS